MENAGKTGGTVATMALSRSKPKGFLSLGFGFSLFLISLRMIKASPSNNVQFAGSLWVFPLNPTCYVLDDQELSYLTCNINSFLSYGILNIATYYTAQIYSLHEYSPNGECY